MIPFLLLAFLSNPTATVLAQVAGPEWAVFLAQTGVAGAVLVWFMFRTEGILKGIVASNDRLARTQLLLMIAFKATPPAIREEAAEMLRDLDQERTKKP